MATILKQIVGAIVLAASAVGAAQADTVKFTGFLGGRSAAVDIDAPANTSPSAGEFSILLNGQSFSSLCVDVQHTISWNTNYSDYTVKTAGAYGFSTAQIGLFNKLYTAHYADSHTSSDKAAAFQIAVWEITYDGNSALNLGANTFKLGSGGSSNAKTIATGWLNTLGTVQQGQWQFKVLDSGTRQDQLIAMPVPEPTELAMLLAGLGLIGSVARRRARAVSVA